MRLPYDPATTSPRFMTAARAEDYLKTGNLEFAIYPYYKVFTTWSYYWEKDYLWDMCLWEVSIVKSGIVCQIFVPKKPDHSACQCQL